ncbi:hypothetical protein TTHERM_00782140 (macronuclear) [Tetrahymena thermophila SB210]|uniref:Transmembrane protein n=1 Tax=Tetrahymena thermophila (strain SB210) TaxID=312017 RepID=Q231S7_TETTS|nr:hypothetical protein TTHERM_00782140 [Tetrahymena thermophila SB210]EAR91225.2 hypothetical protein TTHERM_00782140 [Tetrahymena thermophila SB210]|eukprot:XP_001011470.2 hypothetical protein TTHERM_00782140 [Tetrahymena thermophila SB210]
MHSHSQLAIDYQNANKTKSSLIFSFLRIDKNVLYLNISLDKLNSKYLKISFKQMNQNQLNIYYLSKKLNQTKNKRKKEKKMEASLIKQIQEDFKNEDIYEHCPYLKQEKEKFDSYALSICQKYETENHTLNGTTAQQTKNPDMITGSYEPSQKELEMFKNIANYAKEQILAFKEEKINLKENSHFYGFDDSVIELDQLKIHDDGKIKYKNKQDLNIITFLIPGYNINEDKASMYFENFVNYKYKESKTNLFVFFKWSDSSILRITQNFFNNIKKNQESQNYEVYLENLLTSFLNEKDWDNIFKIIAYLVIKAIKVFISLKIKEFDYLNDVISLFETVVNSIIDYFKDSYQQSQNAGAALAEYLNNWDLIKNLKIDFIGYEFGTVVTAYALKNLVNPARYIILIKGFATITEIEESQKNFQMCYNFYTTKDFSIYQFFEKAKLLGDKPFVGTKEISLNNKLIKNKNIDDHDNKMQELYDFAMEAFNNPNNKQIMIL